MALNPIYFQILSPEQANPLGYGALQGTQMANNILAGRSQALKNQQLRAQLPYASDMAQADLALKQAQPGYIESQTAMNNAMLPYAGYKAIGPYIGNYARLLNTQKGFVDSPTGQALVSNNPSTAAAASQLAQNAINGNFPIPGMQSFGNAMPGQLPLSNEQIQRLQQVFPQNAAAQQGAPDVQAVQNAAQMQLLKKTTDATARQKNLYATNIEKTLNQINPDDLTQYAGRPISEYANKIAAPFGMESKNYDDYQKSLNAANLLASQVRQFYGDSIQPSMIHRLEALTNPSTWSNNPALAKSLFNEAKQILGQELGTYREAMKSTAPYKSQGAQNAMAAPSASKILKGVTYYKINGHWYAQ